MTKFSGAGALGSGAGGGGLGAGAGFVSMVTCVGAGSCGRTKVLAASGFTMPEMASRGGVIPLVPVRTGDEACGAVAGRRVVTPDGARAGIRELTASRRGGSAAQGSASTMRIAEGRSIKGGLCY